MDALEPTAFELKRGGAGTPAPGGGAASLFTSVHTLETNVGARKKKPASSAKELAEIRAEARFEKELREKGFGPELNGTRQPPASAVELAYRHGWWQEERDELLGSLRRVGSTSALLDRVENCGNDCFVRVHKETQRPAISANTCRHRFCKPCAITRANLIGGNLRDRLNARRWEKFAHIVLTLKSRPGDLSDQITRLYKCFRKLRAYRLGTVPRSPKYRGRMVNWWNHNVRGGAAFCETTLNADESSDDFGLFHVHLHIVAECRWIPRDDLKSLWKLATGDSEIVWVERIDDKAGAAAEVSKYAAKGIDSAIALSPHKLDELVIAMRGRRLCFTFGAWRGFRLMQTPTFDPNEWVTIGRLNDIHAQAAGGDLRAIQLLQLLSRPPPVF